MSPYKSSAGRGRAGRGAEKRDGAGALGAAGAADGTGTARRIGAIDVGTNSIRLIVAEAGPDGGYRILDDEKETPRLGQGLATAGRMTREAMQRAADAIARMKHIAEGYRVEVLRAIGTCAVREASNRDQFLDLVRQRAGLAVQPISAQEEARLAYRSVSRHFNLRDRAVAVVDIGGGSTEVVLSSGGVVEEVYSLPLGAVRLTEQFGGPDAAAGRRYRRLRRAIRRELRRLIGRPPFWPEMVIGTGGTFTTLANISRARAASVAPVPLRGYEIKRPEARHLADWLREMPLRERVRVPGLSPERAEIIVAGVTIAERVMKHLGVNRLLVHDGGVRDGLLLGMAEALFPQPSAAEGPADPLASARRFAAACGFEEKHCTHVARLAAAVFDQAAAAFPAPPGGWSDPSHRTVLEAAALLHDVGYLINYSKHHQHSYHLIAHADLPGFTPREIRLVANVARYHRRARPKVRHPNFAALPREDRRTVRRLAAILRLADGLDRDRMQRIRDVSLRVDRGRVVFRLDAAENPTVDVWGAAGKARLFEEEFGVSARFEWAGAASARRLAPVRRP